jgi:HlyD family secretion protein
MRKKWLIAGLILVAAGAQGTAVWLDRNDKPGRWDTAAVVAADTGPVTVSVSATGTLRAGGTRDLGFSVDGTVAAVAVRPGAGVKAGALLARMDATGATAKVTDAQATLDDAEARLATARTGLTAQATTGLDAVFTAQQRVNQARADLSAAQAALRGTTITAPIAGTVMSVAGPVGSRVGRGATFITLADTAMQVEASFPEADAGSLAAGQDAAVTLTGRAGAQYPATVLRVDPVGRSDGALVTYGVVVNFLRQPAGALVGQSASVEVRTGEVAETLRVPTTAVHRTSDTGGTVLVRGGTQRQVTTGLRGDRYTQITSGLAPGEVVFRAW